jgi:transglutaminase-like putative cysteine protease
LKLLIDHETHYSYETQVRASTQYLRLTPVDSTRQKVLEWKLEAPGSLVRTVDGYGNVLHVLTIDRPVQVIRIRATGVVETRAATDDGADPMPLSPLFFTRVTALTRVDEPLAAFAEGYRRRAGTPSGLADLAAAILKKMPFKPGDTHVSSSAAEAFGIGSGVCQDHAHVFIACCRHLGVPARYVSGYVYSAGQDYADVASHAWAEAWVVDRWRSFDIANNRAAGEDHVRVATGGDYYDACPIRGVRTGGGVEDMQAAARVAQQQHQQ